jgi:hypothetical protein
LLPLAKHTKQYDSRQVSQSTANLASLLHKTIPQLIAAHKKQLLETIAKHQKKREK